MDWIIYVLKDPRDGEVRYVGFTAGKPGTRLRAHINEAINASSERPKTVGFSLSGLPV
jgi:hypothetical protein